MERERKGYLPQNVEYRLAYIKAPKYRHPNPAQVPVSNCLSKEIVQQCSLWYSLMMVFKVQERYHLLQTLTLKVDETRFLKTTRNLLEQSSNWVFCKTQITMCRVFKATKKETCKKAKVHTYLEVSGYTSIVLDIENASLMDGKSYT